MPFSHVLPTGVSYTEMGINSRTGEMEYRVLLPKTMGIGDLPASILTDVNVLIGRAKKTKDREGNNSNIYEILKRTGETL